MKIKTNVQFLQEGGQMGAPVTDPNAAPAGAPASDGGTPQGGEDALLMLAQMAAQALQNNDGQMALEVCQGFLQLVQEMAGGAGGPEAAPQGEPVYGKGGKLVSRIKD
mgnify:CR=1 FL=1|jgi:hypothetical protein